MIVEALEQKEKIGPVRATEKSEALEINFRTIIFGLTL